MLGFSFTTRAGGGRRPARAIGGMADLLRRVAEQADPEAFRELFDTYGPRVKAYMMRQGADAATAEDLAQETLLAVWRRASLYVADKGSAATWIFAIARNMRIDRLRREMPWQELPEERAEQPSSEAAPACAPLSPNCRRISMRWSFSPTSRACRTVRLPSAWACRSAP
jgi:RNA polymerase sigma factor (sigma-70 family)